ncbi:ion transporter [Marinobacter sp. OP 3.4]|uniref:ion transporter n=1 Tax=Marinobacter sp. OP 3.4 TaxID=3076501 RepID=UPI002E2224C7
MDKKNQVPIIDRPFIAWSIAGLILFSVVTFSIGTLPNLSPTTKAFLYYSEIVVVGLFSIEYLCRIYISTQKLRFIFSFYGLIDLLAILPFYLGLFIDLRALRLVRLLRLLRILKLARYNLAIFRFVRAIYLAKEELIIFTIASFVLLFLAAVGIYHFEHEAQPEVFRSILDALWWAVATLTTVGYGDIYPITGGGRLFTFGILMIGLGMIAVPTGIIASSLSDVRRQLEEERLRKEVEINSTLSPESDTKH